MKKWVALFLKETFLHNINIQKDVLDKALYLFSNLEDFEMQIENFIHESRKQYFLATNYYYQLYMFGYFQTIQKSFGKNYYCNSSQMLWKKPKPSAVEYLPQQQLMERP